MINLLFYLTFAFFVFGRRFIYDDTPEVTFDHFMHLARSYPPQMKAHINRNPQEAFEQYKARNNLNKPNDKYVGGRNGNRRNPKENKLPEFAQTNTPFRSDSLINMQNQQIEENVQNLDNNDSLFLDQNLKVQNQNQDKNFESSNEEIYHGAVFPSFPHNSEFPAELELPRIPKIIENPSHLQGLEQPELKEGRRRLDAKEEQFLNKEKKRPNIISYNQKKTFYKDCPKDIEEQCKGCTFVKYQEAFEAMVPNPNAQCEYTKYAGQKSSKLAKNAYGIECPPYICCKKNVDGKYISLIFQEYERLENEQRSFRKSVSVTE